jgi:hypothetical protein
LADLSGLKTCRDFGRAGDEAHVQYAAGALNVRRDLRKPDGGQIERFASQLVAHCALLTSPDTPLDVAADNVFAADPQHAS